MNREIKFRILNNEEQKMHYAIPCTVPEDRDLNDVFKFINDVPELFIMQFTGLHDKNNVPIFEGDVVHKKVSTGQPHSHVVEWDASIAAFKLRDLSKFGLSSLIFNAATRLEVIGNIYESEEYLNAKN